MPRHFDEFLMRRRSSPGMFLVRQHAAIGVVIEDLVLIWAASDAEEWKNRILNIPLPAIVVAGESFRPSDWGVSARVVWNCLLSLDTFRTFAAQAPSRLAAQTGRIPNKALPAL
jgi:hypothetical protein